MHPASIKTATLTKTAYMTQLNIDLTSNMSNIILTIAVLNPINKIWNDTAEVQFKDKVEQPNTRTMNHNLPNLRQGSRHSSVCLEYSIAMVVSRWKRLGRWKNVLL